MDSGKVNVCVCNVRRSSVDICAKFMTQHFSIILISLDAKTARIKRRKIVVWLERTATGHGKPKRTKFRSRPTRLSTGLHAPNVNSIFSNNFEIYLVQATGRPPLFQLLTERVRCSALNSTQRVILSAGRWNELIWSVALSEPFSFSLHRLIVLINCKLMHGVTSVAVLCPKSFDRL